MKKFLSRRLALAMLAGSLLAPLAQAQTSSGPIRWVVGYPAGAAQDFVTRTIAHKLSERLGRTVIVENRPGAGGTVAARTVASSNADGSTVLTADNGILVFNSALFKNLPYDPNADFKSVGLFTQVPFLLLANNAAKYASVKDVVEAMRRDPGKINYATPGIASPHNLAMEMLKDKAKLTATPVHYRGGAPAIQDVIGGQVELIILDAISATPALKAGQMKALGVFSKERLAAYPNVPSIFEFGYTDIEVAAWGGLVVPSATPDEVRVALSQALQDVMGDAEVRAKIQELGGEPMVSNAAQMDELRRTEREYWVPLIRSLDIVLD